MLMLISTVDGQQKKIILYLYPTNISLDYICELIKSNLSCLLLLLNTIKNSEDLLLPVDTEKAGIVPESTYLEC